MDMVSFLSGVVAVLLVESLALIYATEWMREKIRRGAEEQKK